MALLRLKRKYLSDKAYPFAAWSLFRAIDRIGDMGDHYVVFRVSNEHLAAFEDETVVNVLMSTNKADLPVSKFFGHTVLHHEGKRIHAAYEIIKSTSYINHIRGALGMELLPEP